MMATMFSLLHAPAMRVIRLLKVAPIFVVFWALFSLVDKSQICFADTTVVRDTATTSAITHARESAAKETKSSPSSNKAELLTKWDEILNQALAHYSRQEYETAQVYVRQAERFGEQPGVPRDCVLATEILDGVIQFDIAQFDLSEVAFKKASTRLEQFASRQDGDQATLLQWIGRVELHQGKLKDALEHFDAVCEVRKSKREDSQLQLDMAMTDKAFALILLGRLKDARPICDTVGASLDAKQKQFPIEYTRYALMRSCLEFQAGNYEASLDILRKLPQSTKDGLATPLSIEVLLNSSAAEISIGEYSVAEEHANKALTWSQALFETDHPLYQRSQRQLARINLAMDDIEAALKHSKIAAEPLKQGKPRCDLNTADQYDLMGEISRRGAELTDSKKAQESFHSATIYGLGRSAEIYEKCDARLQFDWGMCDLAAVCSAAGREKPAQESYDKVLHELLGTVERTHPKLLRMLSDLAVVLKRNDQNEPARQLLQKLDSSYSSLSHATDVEKSYHAAVLINLGQCQLAKGELEEAERDTTKGIELLQNTKLPVKRQLATALISVAEIRIQQGKLKDADSAINRCTELLKDMRGGRNRLYAKNLRLQAEIHLCGGEYDDAQKKCQEAVAIMDENFGKNDAEVVPILHTSIEVAHKQGDQDLIEKCESRLAELNAGNVTQ